MIIRVSSKIFILLRINTTKNVRDFKRRTFDFDGRILFFPDWTVS